MIRRFISTLFYGLTAATLVTSSLAEDIFALTQNGNLITFDSDAPGTILSTVPITGLQAGETLVGLDFRTSTGQLFAVGSTSRQYSINTSTGVAAVVGAVFAPVLSGARFAVDFNPTVDRLRSVSETGQNLRLNPNDGTVVGGVADTQLAYAALDPAFGTTPRVVGIGYTNSFNFASSTTLYGIDSTRDTLVTIGSLNGTVSPNGGAVFTVGRLGVDTNDFASLDISGQTSTAYASLTQGSGSLSKLYTINLSTGTADLVGDIAGGQAILAIAVASAPAPFDVVVLRAGATSTLSRFKSQTPSLTTVNVTVTGLQIGETLVGIDYRPSNGLLYGLGTTGRLYTLNAFTGAASLVGAAPIVPNITSTNAGISFNPVVDLLRVVDDLDENIRVNPDTGVITNTDTPLAYTLGDPNVLQNPNISTIAYTNAAAGLTTLFGIDNTLNILVTIGTVNGVVSPNTGRVSTVGALGVAAPAFTGLDVTQDGTLLAVINNQLYTVNTTTGAATILPGTATVGGAIGVRAIATVPASALPVVQFSAATFKVVEGSAGAVTVARSGNTSGVVSVDYVITPGTGAETVLDATTGTVTFLNGEAARTISVPTFDNEALSGLLTATLTLSNPVGATLGTQVTTTLTVGDFNDRDGDGFPNDVEAAAGTNPDDAALTPFGTAPAGTRGTINVKNASLKLKFNKTSRDSLSFKGKIPNTLGAIPAGARFIVQLGDVNGKGGVIKVLTFDSNGRPPAGLTFSAPNNGVSKFSLTLTREALAALLVDAGFVNATVRGAALDLNATVFFNGATFAAKPMLLYNASAGTTGIGTLTK